MKKDKESKQLFENPSYNLDAIIKTIENLKKECENIFNLPPPVEKTKSPDVKMEDAEKKAESG